MLQPDPDHRIKPTSSLPQPSSDDALRPVNAPSRQKGIRHLVFGTTFGAVVGLLDGLLVAWVGCILVEQDLLVRQAMLGGALGGSVVGAMIGYMERGIHGELIRPDIATIISVLYGVALSLFAFLFGPDAVRGETSGYVIMATVFGSPVLATALGAALDRAYEAGRRKSWGTAVGMTIFAIAVIVGIAALIATMPLGQDLDKLSKQAKTVIMREWQEAHNMRDASIEHIRMARDDANQYSGVVDATIDGRPAKFNLTARVLGKRVFFEWAPIDE